MPYRISLITPGGFAATIAATGLAMVALSINVMQGHDQALADARHYHETHGRLLAENVARSLDSVELMLDDLRDDLTTQAWWNWKDSRAGYQFLNGRLRVNLPQLRHLLLFDSDGVQRHVSFAPEFKPIVVTDRPYWSQFPAGTDGAHYGPYVGRNTGKITYAIMRRLTRPDGKFTGVLMGAIEHGYFGTFCQSVQPFQSYDGALVNRAGEVLSRCQPEPDVPAKVHQVRDILAAGEIIAAGRMQPGIVHVGKQYLMATFEVPGYPNLQVTTAVRKDEVLADWFTRLIQFLMLAGVGALLLVTSVLLVRRQFSRLQEMARELDTHRQNLELCVQEAVGEIERNRKALELKERYQQALLDNFPFMVWLKDTESRFLAANQLLAEKIGLSSSDNLIGKTGFESMPPEMAKFERADDIAVMESRKSLTRERQLNAGTQENAIWMETYKAPVLATDMTILGTVGFSRDITSRKLAEAALVEAKNAAESASLTKTRFLAAASHDLRQPMQSIRLLHDALTRTSLSSEQKHIVGYLAQSIQMLGELLNALLDISKLDAGVVKASVETVKVEALFHKINADFSPVATAKSLRFKFHFPLREMELVTDGKLLMSLLGNLIGNALKYTERGGILVAIRRRPQHALIQVWDTGIGIAEEHLDNIYEEYFQVGNPERDRTKGLGLGLAVVKRLAALLGTEVTCRSKLGRGSVFEFRLPLESHEPAESASSRPRHVETRIIPNLSGHCIVVVEDDMMVANALLVSLESLGASVSSFANPRDALADPSITEADFYISDLRLPEMSGIEFLDAVRQRSTKSVRAVLLTGDTSSDLEKRAQATPWVLLHKPVDMPSLLAALGPGRCCGKSSEHSIMHGEVR